MGKVCVIITFTIFTNFLPKIEQVADQLYTQKEYDKAKKIYKMIDKRKKYLISLYKLGNYEELKVKSKNEHFASVILKNAEMKKVKKLLEENNLIEALEAFNKINFKYGIAFINYKLGKYEEAEKIFNEINDYYSLGVVNYHKRNYEKALHWFSLANNNYGKAISLFNLGKYDETMNILEYDTINYDNKNLILGDCYYNIGNYLVAEKYYKNDNSNYGLYGLSFTHYRLGKIEEAEKEFLEIINKYKIINDNILYYTARSLQRLGKYSDAIHYFKKIREENFLDKTYYWLGKAYFSLNNPDSSIYYFQKLIKDYNESELYSYARSIVGDIYFIQKNYNKAIENYKEVNSPLWLKEEAEFKIYESELNLGKYSSKIDMLEKFIKENKKSQKILDAKLLLANCYKESGNYPMAISLYEELLHTKFNEKAMFSIGDIYFELENYDSAIAYYYKIIEMNKNNLAYFKLADCYEKLNKIDEARNILLEFINNTLKDNLDYWEAYLKIAKYYRKEGLNSEYINTLLTIYKEMKIENGLTIITEIIPLLGDFYFFTGEYDSAKKYYRETINYVKDADYKAELLAKIGDCEKYLNSEEEAIKLYNEALEVVVNPAIEKEIKEKIKKIENGK